MGRGEGVKVGLRAEGSEEKDGSSSPTAQPSRRGAPFARPNQRPDRQGDPFLLGYNLYPTTRIYTCTEEQSMLIQKVKVRVTTRLLAQRGKDGETTPPLGSCVRGHRSVRHPSSRENASCRGALDFPPIPLSSWSRDEPEDRQHSRVTTLGLGCWC